LPADERVERSLYQRAVGYDLESTKTVEEHAIGEDGKATLVSRITTTQTQHVPGDVGAQGRWLSNRRPRQWRDKLDLTIDPDEKKTSRELRIEMLQFLADNGVKLKLPPTLVGIVKTNGVASIGANAAGRHGSHRNVVESNVRCQGQTGPADERGSCGE
jgi:hypothetical protein